jgi:hypothetical protein
MNRKELGIKLKQLGISDNAYDLYGNDGWGNKTVMAKNKPWSKDTKWKIYDIDERGNKFDITSFDTEDEACESLYWKMVEFKWVMDNAHIHPDNKPKPEEIIGFDVSNDGKVRVIVKS